MNKLASTEPLFGLCAITSESICADSMRLISSVEAAVAGGARVIQYRDKDASPSLRQRQARLLVGLCHQLGARLVINDDAHLAADVGADGVHLGEADGSIKKARSLLGPEAIVGASCGPSLKRARSAAAEGASYLAFGRFHASLTKPEAPNISLATLREARDLFTLPLCAIGGITPANAGPLIEAGVDLIAAVEGVFGARDVRAAAASYAALFKRRDPASR